ncbi:sporulation protein [Priestia megaterium]|nr:sporulation protein [Priestia megaterium]
MAMLGVGLAQIDLILPKKTYKSGECIKGYFLIKGGIINQEIKRIECDMIMINHHTGKEKIIDSTNILTSRLIQAEQYDKVAFTFKLPNTLVISDEQLSYRFQTRLTFDEGVESKDLDIIKIV